MKKESERVGLFIINGVLARFVLILAGIVIKNEITAKINQKPGKTENL